MKIQTQQLKQTLERTVATASIPNLVAFRFIGSRNKRRQYLCVYTYAADCWAKCKAEHATPAGKYDFFAAHKKQHEIESATKKPIAVAIKRIADHLRINIRLVSHNEYHHDKLDFNSDLYRRTGYVTLNM